jgi:hypothetical protein
MTTREQILEWYPKDQMIFWDGFDQAIIGVCSDSQRVIYSKSRCIKILMADMDEEEAADYFEENVGGAYVGDMTPIICIDDL